MKRSDQFLGLLPYLAALISCAPILVGGFPQGHDWALELIRIAEYSHALDEGQLPPHWAPNLYRGFGSPVFLFYSPMFAALATTAASVVGSFASGAAVVIVLASLFGVWTVRRLCDAIPGVDAQGGRIAAMLFALHPYLIGDKLLRNANAEFIALCALPIVITGLLWLERRPTRAAVVIATGLSACLLSHNLTSLVALSLLCGGSLWLYRPRVDRHIWLWLGGGIVVGLSIGAFLLLPSMTLQPLIHIEDLSRGKFDFHSQWQPFSEFFGHSQFFSSGWLTPLSWGLAAVVAVRVARSEAVVSLGLRILVGLLFAGVVFTVLQLPISTPLWEHLPFLPLMQFPWRFMGPLAVVTSVAGGIAAAYLLERRSAGFRTLAEIMILAICVANAWPHLSRYRSLGPEAQQMIPGMLTPERIRSSDINVTVYDEYLPTGADIELPERTSQIQTLPVVGSIPPARVEGTDDPVSDVRIRIDATRETRVELARWFFPEWRAQVAGVEAPVERGANGSVVVPVPAPGGELTLTRRSPRSRRIGIALSLLGISTWVLLWSIDRRAASARGQSPGKNNGSHRRE